MCICACECECPWETEESWGLLEMGLELVVSYPVHAGCSTLHKILLDSSQEQQSLLKSVPGFSSPLTSSIATFRLYSMPMD